MVKVFLCVETLQGIENTPEYKAGFAKPNSPVPYPEGTQQWANYYKGQMDKLGPQLADESRGHKVIDTKLKNVQLGKQPVSDEEYAQHVERMKASQKEYLKKNPKSIYKAVDEAEIVPTGQQKMSQTTAQNDPKQAAATNQALQSLKAGTHSTAPTPMIAKALDAASQGKPVGQQDMKALEPMMKDLTTVAQDPKLAGQFKTLAQQIQQVQLKQQKAQSST